ncbi:sensor histidine kinase [Nibricoccus sp. IMCC34717]|uniref:sensor histidine kinase n=1 Tax=Nibricoccus sp. IMCC34717 TaxID=3034021 RepID=UPI00384AF80E
MAELLLKRSASLVEARSRLRLEVNLRRQIEKKLTVSVQHYARLLSQSRLLQAQSRRLAHQVLTAQEDERREISRELHDEVAQILAGINVQLAALKVAAAINSRSLRQGIARTQRLVEHSVEVVHRYARELRPALLDDLGLVPALRAFIRDLPGRQNLEVTFSAFSGVEELANPRRTVLFRVAQEALTNITRHAHAKSVRVLIRKLPGAVRLDVRDDGQAFDVERMLNSKTHRRLGLLGMRERVEMVGGTFSVVSVRGRGTTVRAVVPFSRASKAGTP